MLDGITGRMPSQRDYLDILGVLYALMRELRGKARNEVESHVDNPDESEIFKSFPNVLKDEQLTHFICDYVRLAHCRQCQNARNRSFDGRGDRDDHL